MRVKLPAVPKPVSVAVAVKAVEAERLQAAAAAPDVFVQAQEPPVALGAARLEGPLGFPAPGIDAPRPSEQLAALTARLRQLATEKVGLLGRVATLLARLPMASGAAEVGQLTGEVEALKGQLGQVEVEIKQVLQQLDALRSQEDQAPTPDPSDRIMQNLEKAADAYAQLLGSLDP